MQTNWLKSRQTKYGAYAGVYTIIVIAVLATANWLGNRHNKSFDATSSKRYSLSDQTIKVVSGLKQDITISYFDENTAFGRAKDLLDRYDTLSTKLTIEYIDPYKKPALAKQYGVRTTGTVLVRGAAKTQEARSLTEEEVTSALIRVLKTGERVACFTTGAGEPTIDESTQTSYSGAKEYLEKNNYKAQPVNLLETPEIPKECSIVVLAGPKVDYPQPVVDKVKAFVEGGGRALFMLGPPLEIGKERVSENKALTDLIASWGVTLNRDLILDRSGVGGLYGLGPEVALASRYESHAIVREMKGTATAFALARSLEVKSADKASAEKLVNTSQNSVSIADLKPKGGEIDPSKGRQDSFTVAAAGTYRTGQANNDGRFVVVGSADWASNYVFRFAGNRDLFLNMMNWLSNDEDLISIRPKDPEDRRIQLTRNQMTLVRTVSQFVLPLIVILAGMMVWWRRR